MRNTLLATAGLLALAACSSDGPAALAEMTPDTLIERAEARADGSLAPQDGYQALFVALPGGATAQAVSFTPEGSGAVAEDVTITFGESGLSMTVDELRAYDLDAGALGSADGAVLASRLDMRGVSFDGMAEITSVLSEKMTEGMVEGILSEEEGEISLDQDFGRYDYRMERLVLDGFTVAAMPKMAAGADDEEGFAVFREYLRVSSMFGADSFLAKGVTGEFAMTQTVGVTTTTTYDGDPDEVDPSTVETEPTVSDVSGSFDMDEFGGADWRGFDIGMQFVRGFETTMVQTVNGETVPATDFRGEEIVVRDFSLAKLVPFIMAKTMPSANDTDLISFGRWDMTGLTQLIGGRPFATTEKATLDLTAWHGLMPTRITYESTDRLEVAGLIEMVRQEVDSAAAMAAEPGADVPDMAMIESLASALRESGLETIRSEGRFDYAYAPRSGETSLSVTSTTEEMGSIDFGLAMAMPDYAQFASTPLEGDDEAEGSNPLSALLAQEAALDRMSLVMDDEGGLDALLQVVIAIADATDASEEPGLAMMQGQTPEGLRQMLAGLVTMGSVQAAAAVPQASEYAAGLSGWLSQGGELSIVIDPAEPLDAAMVSRLQAMEGGPAAAVDALGITVTHTAPDAD